MVVARRGQDRGRDSYGIGMNTSTLLYLKWMTNKILLLFSTGNSAQCYVTAWMRGEFGENGYVYMYGWVHTYGLYVCYPPETITTLLISYQFSSVTQVMSGSLQPLGFQHSRLHRPSPAPGACSNSCPKIGDAIQPSHPLSSPSLPTFILSQHQGLLQWVSSLHQVAKALEFQLQHQSFQ